MRTGFSRLRGEFGGNSVANSTTLTNRRQTALHQTASQYPSYVGAEKSPNRQELNSRLRVGKWRRRERAKRGGTSPRPQVAGRRVRLCQADLTRHLGTMLRTNHLGAMPRRRGWSPASPTRKSPVFCSLVMACRCARVGSAGRSNNGAEEVSWVLRRVIACYLATALGLTTLFWVVAVVVPGGESRQSAWAPLRRRSGPVGRRLLRSSTPHDRRYRALYWRRLLDPGGAGYMLILSIAHPCSRHRVLRRGGLSVRRRLCCARVSGAPRGLALVGLVAFFIGLRTDTGGDGMARLCHASDSRAGSQPCSGLRPLRGLLRPCGTYRCFSCRVRISMIWASSQAAGLSSWSRCWPQPFFLHLGVGEESRMHHGLHLSNMERQPFGELLERELLAETIRTAIWVVIAVALWWGWTRDAGQRMLPRAAGQPETVTRTASGRLNPRRGFTHTISRPIPGRSDSGRVRCKSVANTESREQHRTDMVCPHKPKGSSGSRART
jgi:hypothetical protein